MRLLRSPGSRAASFAALASAVLAHASAAHANRVSVSCSNSTSDATAFQNANSASTPGDEIVIHGPCLLNATITLLDQRTYRGDSRTGTIIRQANGANLPAMFASQSWVTNSATTSDGVRVEGLTLDGNRAANTGTVPLMLRGWNSRIYDVEVDNAPSDGIRVTNLSANGTALTNTSVNSIISDFFIQNSGGAGVRVVDTGNSFTDWVLERGWIADSGTSAVQLDNSAGWQVRNLHIYGVQQNAIDASRCFNTGIHDNYIEDFGARNASGATYFGVRCTIQGDNVSTTIEGNKINMLANPPANATLIFVGIDGVNYGNGRVAVTGNGIVGTGAANQTGLSYQRGSGTSLTVASTGNLVSAVGTARSVGTGVTVNAGQ